MSFWIARVIGFGLMGFILIDVFMTVLYARMGSGIISRRLACWVWWIFRKISKLGGKRREYFLSFAGPIILVLLFSIWGAGLILGTGLIVWPGLGTSMKETTAQTPLDFWSAIYVAGSSITTVGLSDFSPQSSFMRLFIMANSFVGMFIITLSVTYLLQVYNALQSRTTFALKQHVATGDTGDAAELLCGVGPRGDFAHGYSQLAEWAAEMAAFVESHHFYPVLLYFRFQEKHYATARVALLCLDSVTLIRTALDDEQYRWLKESAAVTQLELSTTRLANELVRAYIPDGGEGKPEQQPDVEQTKTRARWGLRYRDALGRMQRLGIKTAADEVKGEEEYVTLRQGWDRYIAVVARHLEHRLAEIDPAAHAPAVDAETA